MFGLFVVLLSVMIPSMASAALCPMSDVNTVCADWHEPAGVLNLKDVVVTFNKNGADIPTPVVVPASAATGGGNMSASMPTVTCESATYKASAYAEYTTSLGVMKSLVVQSIPIAGVMKDRTADAACLKVPENFLLH